MENFDEELVMATSNINNILKIVKLPAMRVVSFHVSESTSPEIEAWNLLEKWALKNNLFENPRQFQIFGFNNPDPSTNKNTYGYEFWISVPYDYNVDQSLNVKDYSGGLYAVMSCKGALNIPETWKTLVETVNNSGYILKRDHQYLEHHIKMDIENHEEMLIDLYCPIVES